MSLYIVKLTPIQAVVKVYGAGATTIHLSTDLVLASETAVAPVVDIRNMWVSVLDATGSSIVRGSDTLYTFTTGIQEFHFDTWADTQDRTSDIVVNIGTSGGTIVLDLRKKGGYGDDQFNPKI